MARGSKPGERRGGRQKGTPNRANAKREAEIKASGLTPADFMLGVMRDEHKPLEVRLEAAKAVAPYVHPRLAQITANVEGTISLEQLVTASLERAA